MVSKTKICQILIPYWYQKLWKLCYWCLNGIQRRRYQTNTGLYPVFPDNLVMQQTLLKTSKSHPQCCDCWMSQVTECVCILKRVPDVSWKGAKGMMADSSFLKSLIEFDKDSITEKQVHSALSIFSARFNSRVHVPAVNFSICSNLIFCIPMVHILRSLEICHRG